MGTQPRTEVVNPTNAPPTAHTAIPWVTPKRVKLAAETNKREDAFNTGKDFKDEGAPLLTNDTSVKAPTKAFFGMMPGIIKPPTPEEMEAFTHMDESAQGHHINYMDQAIVVDIDAKLITSSPEDMRKGRFKESHFPTIESWIHSPEYRRLRESNLILKNVISQVEKQKVKTTDGQLLALRIDPRLVNIFQSMDQTLYSRLKESAKTEGTIVNAVSKRLKEDGFSNTPFGDSGDTFALDSSPLGSVGSSWDMQMDRPQEFLPLLAGPYNKQLYWTDYLEMHSRAFEAWCLTGDTEISLMDGRDLSILELKRELEEKEFVWGYKFNQDKKCIEPVKLTSVYEMGRKECVCVMLDNGRSFIASTDHPMLMRDGSYKESGKLEPGDSMMPLYQKCEGAGRLDGYERIWQPELKRWELTHVRNMAFQEGLSVEDLLAERHGRIIHHKDFHYWNNSPGNFEFVAHSKHMKLHNCHNTPEINEKRAKAMKAHHASGARDLVYEAISEGRTGITVSEEGRKSLSKAQEKAWAGGKYPRTWSKSRRSKTVHSLKKRHEDIEFRIKRVVQMLGPRWGYKRVRKLQEQKYYNHKVVAVYKVGLKKVYHVETDEEKYRNQNFALSIGIFSHNTHNPIAKRIVKVIKQFVLGKGVEATVINAEIPTGRTMKHPTTHQSMDEFADYRDQCQEILDEHWAKNSMNMRGKQILGDLVIFGEQFIRYFKAPWGLKLRGLDPSTVWEVVTDPDDCETEFYIHQQYPTRYQWYVDLPIPTIKFIIRQVPAIEYFHMKINTTSTEVRGRSELFAILGWLKRIKEFACLAEGTRIPLLSGKKKVVEDLVGKHFWVYSFDTEKKQVVPGWATCKKTGKKRCVRVMLDNGRSDVVSYDHPYMLRDGTYLNAEDLTPGQSLMPFELSPGKGAFKKYLRVWEPGRKKGRYVHKLVAQYAYGPPTLEKPIVHHKNWVNPKDNRPNKLQYVSSSEHRKIHREFGEWLWQTHRKEMLKAIRKGIAAGVALGHYGRPSEDISEEQRAYWNTLTPEQIDERIRPMIEASRSKGSRAKKSEEMKLWMSDAEFRKMWDEVYYRGMAARDNEALGRRVSETKLAQRLERYPQVVQAEALYQDGKTLTEISEDLEVPRSIVYRYLNEQDFEARPRGYPAKIKNHKVVSVEPAGIHTVYDLNVEKWGNFALDSGCFTHNSDRVIRNKVANLFMLDIAVEGGQAEVDNAKLQFNQPPAPGSFWIHNKAAELAGIKAEVGSADVTTDWEMLMVVVATGAGISQTYLNLPSAGSKAEALVGTEPDIKSFEDWQEIMESFYQQDCERLFNDAKERGKIPKQLKVKVEITYPGIAEEDKSETLKNFAFMESMSWVSHYRASTMAAREMSVTSYDYDEEQEQIAKEDAEKAVLMNAAYQQIQKGQAAPPSGGQGGAGGPDSMGGGGGDGTAGTGGGSAKKEGIITGESASGRKQPWPLDPRDVAGGIKREAANLRYRGRPQLDRARTLVVKPASDVSRTDLTKARRALHGDYHESDHPSLEDG